MATVVFNYDEHNPIAQNTLDFLKSLGVFKMQKRKMTSIEKAMEDIEKGRVYRIINRAKSAK
ncbi:MAG: hypothetical protein LBE82_03115 [Chitinophagaceae bacterium]|jgi:hypothetical protein|nr:hypothetical protein [Chitinophagaceae bacterium]